MAFAKLTLENPKTGQVREAPVGFSWTTFFFGLFPALLRSHWGGALIQLLIAGVTLGLSALVFPFIYNKMYIKHLVGEGFKVTDTTADMTRIEGAVGMRLPRI